VNPREQAAKTVLIEQQAHLQRLAVCTRLRELADETGDESLNKKADDLEAKAYELYQQRISHLPSARELNRSAEKSLDRELGRGVETDPIRSDAKKPSKAEEKASAKREEKK
jgi:N-methylhydantoinase B/oxoprolinase/acetone carboxylase alpha subunit